MAKLQKYYISNVDFDKFYFKSTAGLYQSIGSVTTGIYPASNQEQDLPELPVKNLLQKGLLLRLNAIVIIGTKRRSIELLCNRLVFPAVLDSALNKTFTINGGASGQIKSLSQKRKQTSRG